MNVYVFVGNGVLNGYDVLGLAKEYRCCDPDKHIPVIQAAETAALATVRDAIDTMDKHFTPTELELRYNGYFNRNPGFRADAGRWYWELKSNLNRIEKDLVANNYVIRCYNRADPKGGRASAPKNLFQKNVLKWPIGLYTDFFTATDHIMRASDILHEVSHYSVQTRDFRTGLTRGDLPRTAYDAYFIGSLHPDPKKYLDSLWNNFAR